MIASPFSPIFFPHHRRDGIESRYIQTFAKSDDILLEMIGPESVAPEAVVYVEPQHAELYRINFGKWDINSQLNLYFTTIKLSPGIYSIEIAGIGKSDVFRVTDDSRIIENTTLIQYSMDSNRHRRDAVFFIDGMQRFFDFRVPGGFKDSNWSFSVEGEQFVTDESDIIQLYGLESTQKKFTLGNSEGCPVWFAEMLNRLLCCTYVYFDGERYARKESAVPEMSVVLNGVNSFVFSQNLQKVTNIDPILTQNHKAIIRRIDTDYRIIPNNNIRAI